MKQTMKWLAFVLALLLMGSALAACQVQEEEAGVFCVIYDDVEIELGKPAETILDQLGAADSEDQVYDCGEGKSRIRYRYDSMTIYVMKADGDEVIDQIELLDDLVETSRGICIGDEEQKVRELYGTPSSDKNGVISYSKDSMQIQFDIKDGTVSAIGLLRRTQ